MKQFKIFAAVVVAAFAFSSCASYSFTSRSTSVNREDINGTAMVVDVRPDFSKRIMTESGRCKTPNQAREEAKYLAVTSNKCDVIVDPVYKVEKRNRKYKAYLTGFAGFYENPRTFYEDLKQMKNISKEDIEKYLTLKDPSLIRVLNPQCNANVNGNTEIINIYEGGKPECCKEASKDAPAKQEPAASQSSSKKRK